MSDDEKDIYENLPYRILPKKSASPTLLIINKVKQNIMKIWLHDEKTEHTEALSYEQNIYNTVINNIIREQNNAPLLKYIGDGNNKSVEDLGKLLGCKDENQSFLILKAAFYIYSKNTKKQNKYNSKQILSVLKNPSDLKIVDNLRINAIILPLINYTSLSDQINTCSYQDLVGYITQIISGIYLIYNKGLVHNDLHLGNIMIEQNTNKVLIFDWDRAYLLNEDNPLLDSHQCGRGRCSRNSQCNIYHTNGYATDMYKVLYYIFTNRSLVDQFDILQEVFKIGNFGYLYSNILSTLKRNAFFSYEFPNGEKCTYLQYPDSKMKEVINHFGTIHEIYSKINNRNSRVNENEQKSFVDNLRQTSLEIGGQLNTSGVNADLLRTSQINTFFPDPSSSSDDEEYKNSLRSSEIERMIQNPLPSSVLEDEDPKFNFRVVRKPLNTKKYYQNLSKYNRKPTNKSQSKDLTIKKHIKNKNKISIPKNIIKEIERLNSINPKEVTYNDVINLRHINEYLRFGPSKISKVEKNPYIPKHGPKPKPKPLWEIIQDNDLRKYGPGL